MLLYLVNVYIIIIIFILLNIRSFTLIIITMCSYNGNIQVVRKTHNLDENHKILCKTNTFISQEL